VLVFANAFFVAAEFGLVAVDRARVNEESSAGSKAARRVKGLVENLSFHLSGSQLGITVSSLVLGFIAEPTLAVRIEPLLERWGLGSSAPGLSIAMAIALATVFQMVVGELVPKTIAIDRPYEVVTRLGRAISIWGVTARPVIALFDAAANTVVRWFGIEPADELEHIRSLDEIELLIESSGDKGTLDEQDVTLLKRSIRLGEKTAADALIPRMEILSLGIDAMGADLVDMSLTTGKSRFPVYGDDADDVLGVVHVKSIHGIAPEERATTSVRDLMTKPIFIPESIDLDDLLAEVRGSRNHLAIVLDEHGGTAGIITLEDILEEIVGEIDDEYDEARPSLTRIEQRGTFVVAGRMHHDEVFEACGFSMPDGEYETLAGFVLDRLGRIPEPGARFEYDGWRFEVVAMARHRVASVRLVAPPPNLSESVPE